MAFFRCLTCVMPPVGMNGKSSKNRGQSHGMTKFQCWTIRSNVILFSYIIFLFSPAFIKQSIPSSFIMVFFLPYFVCYFVSNFLLFGTLVMCTIFFIDVGRRRVTRSNFLFVQLQFLVSGVYRFSLASAWIWAWTFYVFIPSFFFCCRFQTSHSFYFNAFVFLAFFFHSFVHLLIALSLAATVTFSKWHNIHIAFNYTFQGDFLLLLDIS